MGTEARRPYMVSSKAVPLALFSDYDEAKAYFNEVLTENPTHCASFKKMHFTKVDGVLHPTHQILAFHFAEKKTDKYREYLGMRKRVKIQSVNKETKQTTTYESMEHACRALGLKSPSSIYRAMKDKAEYDGCMWSKVEDKGR